MTIVRGTHEEKTLSQMADVARDAVRTALMADGHLGYYMPIGGVAAYRNQVSPHGVGVDIACGNAAIKTDLTVDDLEGQLPELADEIVHHIGFGMNEGRTNRSPTAPKDHDVLSDDRWNIVPDSVRNSLRDKARAQLGTCGGGNHYVDIFRAEDDAIWIGCHFGSRGFGYMASNGMIALAQGGEWKGIAKPKADWNDPVLVGLETQIGMDYWNVMEMAGEYAYAGREWVVEKVAEIMGATEIDRVHNHHNFAWMEWHYDEKLVVVRKGATPAFPGQRGFVGGSMGDISVILRGSSSQMFDDDDLRPGSPEQRDNLFSTVHGAGRVMGRMQAKGKWKRGKCVRPGLISKEDMLGATRGLIRRGGDLDEAPQAYRPLESVLEAQGDTIVVEERLTPLVVCMAPGNMR